MYCDLQRFILLLSRGSHILVLEQPNFETLLKNGEINIPASTEYPDLSVDSGDLLNLTLEVSNTGNTPIDLEVSIQPSIQLGPLN